MIYGKGHNGKTIPAMVGETVLIELEENPTTGYLWEIDTPPEVSGAMWFSNEYLASKPVRVGSGGIRRLKLQPQKTGRHSVSFCLKRPWEVNSIKTFQITLAVGSNEHRI